MMIRFAVKLCLITTVAGLGLGFVYSATKDRIAQSESAKTVNGITSVLPGYKVDPENVMQAEDVPYWIGQKDDGTVGYAFIAAKSGYSSTVQTMVGIDSEGRILGISVLSQQETPGLGARVQEIQSNVFLDQKISGREPEEAGPTTPWFADQFRGLSSKKINIQKGKEWHAMSEPEKKALLDANAVSALSGATISTKAVTDSIEEASQKVLAAVQKKEPESKNAE